MAKSVEILIRDDDGSGVSYKLDDVFIQSLGVRELGVRPRVSATIKAEFYSSTCVTKIENF